MKADLLKDIYRQIRDLYTLQPWEELSETDIFGIRLPEKEQVYYVSVIGGANQMRGISFYKGNNALASFWFIQNTEGFQPESILNIPHYMITFDESDIFPDEQKSLMKKSGISFEDMHEYPVIHEVIPGRVPEFPQDESLADLPVLLEQSLNVLQRATQDKDLFWPDKNNEELYLVRKQSEKSGEWEDTAELSKTDIQKFKISYQKESLEKLIAKQKKPVVLQLDLNLLPAPTKDERDIGFFPFTLLIIDKEKNKVLEMENLVPLPDVHTMYESVPKKVLELLNKLPYKPFRIEIRNEILNTLLDKILKQAGIDLKLTEHLKVHDLFFESLKDELLK